MHYCVAGYFDKKTDLLDDKCGHIGLGSGVAGGMKKTEAYFFKKRNPLIAMWDAKRVIRELHPTLVDECFIGNEEWFNSFKKSFKDFGTEELD